MQRFQILSAIFFSLTSLSTPALAAGSSDSEVVPLSFCSFGPKMKVFVPAGSQEARDGRCPAPVQVQGVQWECLSKDKADKSVENFRQALESQAKEECDSYCKAKSTGASCTGRLDTSQVCGLQTGSADAAAVGKRMGCRTECSGQAMAFCSLYEADYTSGNAAVLAGQPPNCHCIPSSKAPK